MCEKPFPSLFCHAGPGRGLCLCCPQLSRVMLALNTPCAEHPLALSFFLGIEFFAIQSFILNCNSHLRSEGARGTVAKRISGPYQAEPA